MHILAELIVFVMKIDAYDVVSIDATAAVALCESDDPGGSRQDQEVVDAVSYQDVEVSSTFVKKGTSHLEYNGEPNYKSWLFPFCAALKALVGAMMSYQMATFTLLDARARQVQNLISYEQQGFTLVKHESAVTDWTAAAKAGSKQEALFMQELNQEIMKLQGMPVQPQF